MVSNGLSVGGLMMKHNYAHVCMFKVDLSQYIFM